MNSPEKKVNIRFEFGGLLGWAVTLLVRAGLVKVDVNAWLVESKS